MIEDYTFSDFTSDVIDWVRRNADSKYYRKLQLEVLGRRHDYDHETVIVINILLEGEHEEDIRVCYYNEIGNTLMEVNNKKFSTTWEDRPSFIQELDRILKDCIEYNFPLFCESCQTRFIECGDGQYYEDDGVWTCEFCTPQPTIDQVIRDVLIKEDYVTGLYWLQMRVQDVLPDMTLERIEDVVNQMIKYGYLKVTNVNGNTKIKLND